MKRIVIPIYCALILAVISACSLLGPVEDGYGALALTTRTNVLAEGQGAAESLPLNSLPKALRSLFEKESGELPEVVLVDDSYLWDKTGQSHPVLHLDARAGKELLSPPIVDVIEGLAGTVFPPAAPFIPLLALLFKRPRKHAKNMVKNLIPGVMGTNGGGRGIDLVEASKDLCRMFGLEHSRPEDQPHDIPSKSGNNPPPAVT